jgi:hypothetical protein
MADKPRDASKGTPASTDERASPSKGNTTAQSGYAEKHGPRHDPDGWGKANPAGGDGAEDAGRVSQGQAAGERSFGDGAHDAAEESPK